MYRYKFHFSHNFVFTILWKSVWRHDLWFEQPLSNIAWLWLYLWIVRTTGLSYDDQTRSTGIVQSDALQAVHQTIRTWSHHWFRPLTATLRTWWSLRLCHLKMLANMLHPTNTVGCYPYLTLRTLQALHFPVRWLRTTENSTSSPVWSSRPSCTSFTWKNSFLLSPTSYVMKPNWGKQKYLQYTKVGIIITPAQPVTSTLMFTNNWSLPGLWRTPPWLCAEGPHYRPFSVQFGVLCKAGTLQALLSADNQPCLPYPWFQRDNLGL